MREREEQRRREGRGREEGDGDGGAGWRVPGDVVLDLSSMANQTIKLGGGLHQDCDAIFVMKAGKLRFVKPNKYWVESSQKRYVPCVGDNVLGIVVDSKADVNAEAPSTVILVSNAIMNSESLSGVQQKIMVEKLLQRVQ